MPALPPLPKPLPSGNYPVISYARRRLGLSQTELASRAAIRVETLNRIERAKMTPIVATMQKIDRVLTKLES